MGDARLTWGSTTLLRPDDDPAYVGVVTGTVPFLLTAMSAGTTGFGNPEAVITDIRTHLQDGSRASITSRDNRSGKFRIKAESSTWDGLAAAEKQLAAEASVPGYSTLTWTPSVALAYPTVFDVVFADVQEEYDDFSEQQLRRYFIVEFELLPFGRDSVVTTVQATAPAVTPVTESVDTGSSATGWTATNGSAPVVASGAVQTTAMGQPGRSTTQMERAASKTITAGRLYAVDWQADSVNNVSMTALTTANSLRDFTLSDYVDNTGLRSGFRRTWFTGPSQVSGATDTAALRVRFSALSGDPLAIDQLLEGSERTVFDDGSTASGWSASNGISGTSAVTSSNGAVRATAGGLYSDRSLTLNRTGNIDVTSTPYLVIDWKQGTRTSGASLVVNNNQIAPLVADATAPSGLPRSYYSVPSGAGGTVTSFNFGFTGTQTVPHGETFAVDQVSRTNVVPGSGTNRQQSRSLEVGGSARARASLVLSTPTTNGLTLGDLTILYTRSATTGFKPPLRPLRVSGPATTSTSDATALASLSGAYGPIGTSTPTVFLLPANKLREAAHLLIARTRATATGTYTIAVTATLATAANADIPETSQVVTGSATVTYTTANTWQANEVALLQLPTVPVAADSTHVIRLTLAASSTAVQWDEMWLFDLNNGALSIGNSTGLSRLEFRTADLENDERTVWGGTAANGAATGLVRADWRTVPVVTPNNITAASFGDHELEPGTVDIFTATSGTDQSSAFASYYRAWLHNAGAPEGTTA